MHLPFNSARVSLSVDNTIYPTNVLARAGRTEGGDGHVCQYGSGRTVQHREVRSQCRPHGQTDAMWYSIALQQNFNFALFWKSHHGLLDQLMICHQVRARRCPLHAVRCLKSTLMAPGTSLRVACAGRRTKFGGLWRLLHGCTSFGERFAIAEAACVPRTPNGASMRMSEALVAATDKQWRHPVRLAAGHGRLKG